MTNVLYFQGQLGRALDQYDQVVDLFQSLGHRRGEAMVRINIASIRLTILGEIERAKPEAAAALAYYQEVGDPIGEGQCLATLGEIARQEGDLETAKLHVNASLETLLAAKEQWIALQVYRNLVLMSLDAGQAETALEQITAATVICQGLDVPDMQVYFDALQGLAFLALGRTEEALASSQKAMENWKPEMDQSYLVAFWYYRVLEACGHQGKAHQVLTQSRALLLACLTGLSPEQQAGSLQKVPEHRAIAEAWEASPVR